jgi:outer membrane protein assembly factor BamA
MLTHKIRYKIILSLLISSLLIAQVKIQIHGNASIEDAVLIATVREALRQNFVSNEEIEKVKEGILNIYIENGFYYARIDSIKIDPEKVEIFINEGKQAKVGEFEIYGNKTLKTEEVMELLGLKRGDVFYPAALKSGINKILDRYANIGYPLAQIEIENFSLEENGDVKLKIKIDEGEIVKINDVKIVGNNLTNENLIIKEARFKKGEIYSDRKFKQIKKRLMKLGIFESVSDPEIFFNDTTSGILIKVNEGRMNSFDGVIGYMPEGANAGGYLVGYINIFLKNLFGTGRKFGARWNSENKYTQEFEIRYYEPYIFNFPLGAEFFFHQRKQDSTYVVRKPQLTAELELTSWENVSEIFKVFFQISQTSIIPTATEYLPFKIDESKTLNFGFGILYDSRDEINLPKTGIFFKSFYELGDKKTSTARLKRNRFNIEIEFYFDFHKTLKSVFVPKLNFWLISGDRIDEGDAFRFGGMKTLRGYREREFIATRAFWANFENRFGLSSDFILFPFFDIAYIYRPVLPPRLNSSSESLLYGYGLGLKIFSKIGWLNLIYALGKGDSFKTGKIHIGVESEF